MPNHRRSTLARPDAGGKPARGDRGGGAPTSALTIVREPDAPYARCPHCGERLELSTIDTRWLVRTPADLADRLILQLGTLPREELHVLLLNTKCVVIGQERVYQGNVSSSLVRIGELFREAVHRHASAVILCHNHPSGDPTPSPDDLHLTAEAMAGGRLLEIPVLDHLIVAGSSFVSLRERGVAFDQVSGRSGSEAPR